MPYGHAARNVRAYTYGCDQPVEGQGEAVEQHRLRTRLWNALVEIELARRAARDALIASRVNGATGEALAAARREAYRLPEVKEQLAALDRGCYEASKPLYRGSGCYWGNYLDVINGWNQARRGREEPRFHRYQPRDGKVSIRWPKGIPVARAWGEDTQLRIDPPPADAYTHPSRNQRRRLCRTLIRVRVRSDERHQPVWLVLPVWLHRPLPSEGLIRQVHVTWRPIAGHLRWEVSLVVEVPEAAEIERAGRVALDLCWRKRPGGLRVAYWLDSAGKEGEVLLEPGWLSEMERVEGLRSLRDKQFNATRQAFSAWLRAVPDVPDWLREATATLAQWRSPARLAGLALRWRGNRWTGDEAGYGLVEAWRKEDRHHWEYEANLRDQLIGRRREQYRVLAARLAREYGEVVLEDFSLADLARVKPAEPDGLKGGGAELHPEARYQRVMAATYSLRQAIANACKREGVRVTTVPAAYTTLACPMCGEVQQIDKLRLIGEWPCCGLVADQDAVACANLLAWSQQPEVRAV